MKVEKSRLSIQKGLVISCLLAPFFFAATPTHASTLEQLQVLLQQLQAQLQILQNQSNSTNTCVQLSRDLAQTDTDAETGGQVGKLQQFLRAGNYYTYPTLTGYYGEVTKNAVINWQMKHNVMLPVVLPEGGFENYGMVGSKTRAAMALGCEENTIEITKSPNVNGISLLDRDIVYDLMLFTVDAKESDVTLKKLTVSVALPYVKAGDWNDFIKNIYVGSYDPQQPAFYMTSVTDTNTPVLVKGQENDEVLFTFTIPSSLYKSYTIPKGSKKSFTIGAEFKPGFSGYGLNDSGYVHTTLVTAEANVPLKTTSVYSTDGPEGPTFPIANY